MQYGGTKDKKMINREILKMLEELRKYWKGDTPLDYLINIHKKSLEDKGTKGNKDDK